jgi:integrase
VQRLSSRRCRPIWATVFYAGLRRGELQALRCTDVDLRADLIHVRKGWDQVEGEIEPKSPSAKRAIPILSILRGYLVEQAERTDRTGRDRFFGRSAQEVFYASTVDVRAKRAWRAYNVAEREAATGEGREPELLTVLTMHECRHAFASVLIDTGPTRKRFRKSWATRRFRRPLTSTGTFCRAATTTSEPGWMPTWLGRRNYLCHRILCNHQPRGSASR